MTTTPEQRKAYAEALLNDPNSTDPQVRQIRAMLGAPSATPDTARREDIIGQIAAEATWHAHRTPANSPCKHCLAARGIASALTPHIEAMLAQAQAEALREAADEARRIFDTRRTLGMATDDWLRDRADELEAGEDRG